MRILMAEDVRDAIRRIEAGSIGGISILMVDKDGDGFSLIGHCPAGFVMAMLDGYETAQEELTRLIALDEPVVLN